MPIYEYQCECGEVVEAIERVGTERATCGELCKRLPPTGDGKVSRLFSGSTLRGTGHEAKEPAVDVHKRARRPWDDCK
ncbi:MAG: hypothetical protein EXR72_01665 [Myxococcales bacterium]|nr:hypothetical protein [Myxococcales bacterium]